MNIFVAYTVNRVVMRQSSLPFVPNYGVPNFQVGLRPEEEPKGLACLLFPILGPPWLASVEESLRRCRKFAGWEPAAAAGPVLLCLSRQSAERLLSPYSYVVHLLEVPLTRGAHFV